MFNLKVINLFLFHSVTQLNWRNRVKMGVESGNGAVAKNHPELDRRDRGDGGDGEDRRYGRTGGTGDTGETGMGRGDGRDGRDR